MRLVVVSFVGLLAAACTPSPEQKRDDVCMALCDCTSASPAKVEECVGNCMQFLPTTLPDACTDCVYQYSQSCGDLESKCEAACEPQQQPQP